MRAVAGGGVPSTPRQGRKKNTTTTTAESTQSQVGIKLGGHTTEQTLGAVQFAHGTPVHKEERGARGGGVLQLQQSGLKGGEGVGNSTTIPADKQGVTKVEPLPDTQWRRRDRRGVGSMN